MNQAIGKDQLDIRSAAAVLGKKGGQSKSAAKAAAARRNARKKTAVPETAMVSAPKNAERAINFRPVLLGGNHGR